MTDYKAAIDLLLLGIEHEHDNLRAFYEQNVGFPHLVDDDLDDDLNGDVEDEFPHFPVPEILPAGPLELVPILVPLLVPEEEEERPRWEIVEYRELMRINGNLDLDLPFLPGRRIEKVVMRLHAEVDADVGPDARPEAEAEGMMGGSVEMALCRRRRESEVEDKEAEYEADEEMGEEEDAAELAEESAPETEEDEDWEHIPKPTNKPSSSSESNPNSNDSSSSESSTWSTTVHIEQEQDEKEDSILAKIWTLFDFCRAFVVASSRELAEKPGVAQRPRSFLEVFG